MRLLVSLMMSLCCATAHAQSVAVHAPGASDGALVGAVELGVEAEGFVVRRPQRGREALEAWDRCRAETPGPGCVTTLGESPPTYVLVLVEESVGADIRMIGRVVSADGVDTLATDERYCEACEPEARRTHGSALGRQLGKALRAETGQTRITLKTRPPGATVTIDGTVVGVTPLDYQVYPGPHVVELHRDGYASTTRTVDVVAGEAIELDLQLRRGARFGAWKWVAVGSGVALIGGGALLIGMDHGFVKDGRQQEYERNTAGWGYATAGIGVVAVATGVTMLVLDRRVDEAPPVQVSGMLGPGLWGLVLGRDF